MLFTMIHTLKKCMLPRASVFNGYYQSSKISGSSVFTSNRPSFTDETTKPELTGESNDDEKDFKKDGWTNSGEEESSRFSYSKLIGYAVGTTAGSYVAFKLINLFALDNDNDVNFKEARNILLREKESTGSPCLVCSVWVNGKPFWKEAVGLSDVENCVECTSNAVMRVASISKAFTSIGIGKMLEEKKLDLDQPIQDYVPTFPKKKFNGKDVSISLRQIMSHTSGIRSYKGQISEKYISTKNISQQNEIPEFYIKNNFEDSLSTLKLFADDNLISIPGSMFTYSTLAYSLVAAALENISEKPFTSFMKEIFDSLGMKHTFADDNDRIIDYRTRYYCRDENGLLNNCPYVDLSCKFAGGGFLSSVTDLNKFGSALLKCYQSEKGLHGILKRETVEELWSVMPVCSDLSKKEKGIGYALGWEVKTNIDSNLKKNVKIFHSGCAVGCSSLLMIIPSDHQNTDSTEDETSCQGIVISIMANIQGVSLRALALKLADLFLNE